MSMEQVFLMLVDFLVVKLVLYREPNIQISTKQGKVMVHQFEMYTVNVFK